MNTFEWRPIETAPEKVPILVTDGKLMIVIKRSRIVPKDPPTYMGNVGFFGYEWEWEIEWKDLTHWMPLPPPPISNNP